VPFDEMDNLGESAERQTWLSNTVANADTGSALQVGNDGYDRGLLAVVLDQYAFGARAVGCTVAPIKFDELLGDHLPARFSSRSIQRNSLLGDS
jgi:hypothetical protein